jgi:hypothetical protein
VRTLLHGRLPRRGHFIALVATSLVASSASGQEAARAEADRAFQEGRIALARGALDDACSKFARSYALLPRHGTLLNLALCLKQSGKNVEAFHRFEEGLAAATQDGRPDREELARKHLDELKSKLAWLSIEVAQVQAVPKLHVLVDGVPLETLGSPQPAEPGTHLISASAPGRVSYEVTVAVEAGDSRTIEIPPLALEPHEAPLSSDARPQPIVPIATPARRLHADASPSASRKPLGIAFLGTGMATLVVGGVVGLRAMLDGRSLRRTCPELKCTSTSDLAQANGIRDRARTAAHIADVTIPVGAIVAGVGLYLWMSEPTTKSERRSARTVGFELSPAVSPSLLGANVDGSW